MATASGTLAGVVDRARRYHSGRTPGFSLFVFAGTGVFRVRSRHDRRAHHHLGTNASRWSNSRPMKTFTCLCRVWTIGREWRGTTPAVSSRASGISLDANDAQTSRCSSLVAPALHVHPATDTLLHYISPAIGWALLGIDERWRKGVRVVLRKRPERKMQMIKAG
jgi:hypothetical protein